MSKISYIGSIDSKIQNNEMLKFARQTMNEEQFRKLYKSYRQLFWFQLSLPISAVLIIALSCIIFSQYAEATFCIRLCRIYISIYHLAYNKPVCGRKIMAQICKAV